MLTHIVLFKLKAEYQDQAQELARRLRGMAGAIPAIQSLEAGPNVLPSARSYDVALITRHADAAALHDYRVHPVHQAVLDFIGEVVEQVVAADIES